MLYEIEFSASDRERFMFYGTEMFMKLRNTQNKHTDFHKKIAN